MRTFTSFLSFAAILAILSCDRPESAGEDKDENSLVTGTATTTIFTANLSGSFSEKYTPRELSLGKVGFLLVEKSADSHSALMDWCDNVKSPGCNVCPATLKNKSCTYSVSELKSSTEYDYCLFFESESGKREIGNINSFKTEPFTPDMRVEKVANTGYIIDWADYFFAMDSKDLKYCTVGIELFSGSDSLIMRDNLKRSDIPDDGRFSHVLQYLRLGFSYKTRLFIRNINTGDTAYSGFLEFETSNPGNLTKTDLGLKVMWADRSFGYDDINMNLYFPLYYRWGHVEPGSGMEDYKYWQSVGESYLYIGDDISGTSFDPIHYYMGEKWRMARKSDFEELIENTTSTVTWLPRASGTTFTSIKNGKTIFLYDGNYWTSNLCYDFENLPNGQVEPWTFSVDQSNDQVRLKFDNKSKRYYGGMVMPVWDPDVE